MKRLLVALCLLSVAAAGCINPHVFGVKDTDRQDTAKTSAGPRPPTVYPHQVDESNAHAMAQALNAEMEYDAHQDDAKAPAR
jgi:hypothetical protein